MQDIQDKSVDEENFKFEEPEDNKSTEELMLKCEDKF